ncbi:DUF6193 family natural product biosynthesis protein (plasmid) [Streptomyces sp. NBC_01591]|uniref:DUF6193 family natural product biosynthesis protein n=1 Tax=Streptomyces sp. NBC_01591 TaxID=2975888 RepID=UPI002DD9CFB8|nr:DUF6193 family natural product biosynthesis protein [Streptomyces sp. NBC_01591]WSD74152.1 DUF6193 family natural product biosynthesis protein [Streptomyces sp. NBC_01591]
MNERSTDVSSELYPELALPGGLGEALGLEAARRGGGGEPMDPVEGFDPAVVACCARGEARFTVYATNIDEREFRIEISGPSGWRWGAFGSTDDLAVVAAILHAWRDGASIAQLRREWTLLAATPLDAAPPGRVVSTAWRLTLERSPVIRLGNAELAEALYAQPALRVFFPWPSHGQFSLLSSTADPFHEEVPRVIPTGDGLWSVVVTPSSPQTPSRVLGTRLSARDAAALMAANVPAGSGPAIEGGWPTGGSTV